MVNKHELCEKIRLLFPDIGECGIDVSVDYNTDKKAWVVDLKKGSNQLKTHLEPEEVDQCLIGEKCISLGIQVAQLKQNIKDIPRFT